MLRPSSFPAPDGWGYEVPAYRAAATGMADRLAVCTVVIRGWKREYRASN